MGITSKTWGGASRLLEQFSLYISLGESGIVFVLCFIFFSFPLRSLHTSGGMGMGGRQQPVPLLAALPELPTPRLPWEPLLLRRQSGRLSLPKHTQPRGYSLCTNTAPLAKQFWKKGGWQRPRALRLPPSSGGSGPSVCKREDRGLGRCVQNRPQKGKPSILRFLQPISFNCMTEMIKKKQNIVFVVGWGFF